MSFRNLGQTSSRKLTFGISVTMLFNDKAQLSVIESTTA